MIKDVHFAYQKAHQAILKLGYWKFLLTPIFLSAALALILISLCLLVSTLVSGLLHSYIENIFSFPAWMKILLTILIFALSLAPCYIFFRSLVIICYSPFLDKISKEAERLINGTNTTIDTHFKDSIKRSLLMAFYSISGVIIITIASFAFGFIPFIGILISGVLIFPANLFLSSVSYLDPYLSQNGYTPTESIKLMWSHRVTVMYFGLIGFCITIIPFFGWFIGPTYSVVAGVILSILLHNNRAKPYPSTTNL